MRRTQPIHQGWRCLAATYLHARDHQRLQQNGSSLLIAGLITVIIGCGAGQGNRADDQQRAHHALAAALDGWKDGRTVDDLRQHDPEIIVGDLQWKSGMQLLDYRLNGNGAFDGKHLRMPVTLIVQSRDKRRRELHTSYIVGVDPVITVIRELE